MGGLVQSILQRGQKMHELELSYASLCFRYVAFVFIIIVYASQEKRCYVYFMILCLYYTSPKKYCYVTFMLHSLFYDSPNKCCSVIIWFLFYFMLWCGYNYQFILCFSNEIIPRYSYTSTHKHIFNKIITVSNFGKHKNILL